MIVPELKDWDCVEHDPIEEYVPGTDEVWYTLTLHIGPADEDGADLFRVQVATPRGLAQAKQAGHVLGPGPPVVVAAYDWDAVLDAVQARVARCRGHAWLEVQEKLRRQFRWEYEGYG